MIKKKVERYFKEIQAKIEKNTVQERYYSAYAGKCVPKLYPTLYYDETASELIDKIDYDWMLRKTVSLMQRFDFGGRDASKKRPAEVRDYLNAHPNAAVVNLAVT